ncbi:MAG: hypothetical protein ACLT3Y_05915 [Ruminococcus callidus]
MHRRAAGETSGQRLLGLYLRHRAAALPLAWGMGIVRPKFYLESAKRLVVLVAAFYCVLFYSAFLLMWNTTIITDGIWCRFFPSLWCSAQTIDRLRARVTLGHGSRAAVRVAL